MRVLCCVLVLLLAGCSGGLGGDPTTTTVTPADVPGDRTTTVERRITLPAEPPETATIWLSHAGILSGRSYTVTEVRAVRAANGTLLGRSNLTVRATPDTRYAAHYEATGRHHVLGPGPVTADFYSDGSRLFRRIERGGRTEYGLTGPELYSVFTSQYVSLVHPRPSRTTYVPFRVVVTGPPTRETDPPRFVFRGNETVDPQLIDTPPGIENAANASLVARVDGRGVVRSLTFRYEATVGGEPVGVTRTVVYRTIDVTTVERPAWTDEVGGTVG